MKKSILPELGKYYNILSKSKKKTKHIKKMWKCKKKL